MGRRKKASTKRSGRDELTFLIEHLKENKITKFKSKDYEIEFSPLAFLPSLPQVQGEPIVTDEDRDELLYYSSNSRPGKETA